MVEPTTPLKSFTTPNTGDLTGAWGTAALNPNFVALDGLLGGFATISLSAATTFVLTAPGGSITPGAGPTQQQNSMIRLTGSLSGTCTVQFSMPGFYIIDNKCTVGGVCVILAPSTGTGNSIGAPPGRKCHVFYDGTDMDYVDMPEVGSALDLHGITSVPSWIQASTVKPYLLKDGTTYNVSTYPALAKVLGSAFGGDGVNTFGVPDERNRYRVAIDTSGQGRITAAACLVDGSSMGSAGGDQNLAFHNHDLIDPGHQHPSAHNMVTFDSGGSGTVGAGGGVGFNSSIFFAAPTVVTGATVGFRGTGGAQNIPPTIVSFLPLIKT